MNTKLIALGTIIVAIAAFFLNVPGSIILGIVGLFLLLLPSKYTSDILKKYALVFKNYKKVAITAAFDALFWAGIALIAYAFKLLFEKKLLEEYAKTGFSKEALLQDPAIASTMAESLRGIVTYSLIGLLAVVLLSYAVFALSRYFIWTEISSQKRNKKTLLSYFGLTGAFWGILMIPAVVIVMAVAKTPQASPLIILFFLIAAHFNSFIYTNLTKSGKTAQALTMGIAMGLSKLHLVILPYGILFSTWWILSTLASIINYAYSPAAAAVTLLFAILMLAISRAYLYTIIKSL